MKKILFVLSTIVVLAGCGDKPQDKSDDIVIGTVLSLTKESKLWGQNTLKGARLAVDEINSDGGILGRKLVIDDSGDSESNPNGAVRAVKSMLAKKQVKVIIGDVMSSNTIAIAPFAEKAQKILLNFCVAIELTHAGDYIFRNWNSAISDAQSTARVASQKAKDIVVIYQNDAYGTSLKDEFLKLVQQAGVKVVLESSFDPRSLDFTTLVTSIKSLENYDGIYMASYYGEALSFVKHYSELKGKIVPLFGTSEWEAPEFIDYIAKNYSGEVFYGYPSPPDENDVVRKRFLESYRQMYNEEPGILTDNGYDAIFQIKEAIEIAGAYDSTLVKDALYKVKDFKGASGEMSFDANGDVNKPFGIRTITGEGVAWIE